jgi:ATP-binding cassette subfamily B protein
MSRITNDLFLITETAHHGPEDLLISAVVIIGAYSFMFINSVPLALVSLIPLPFMLFFGIWYGRRLKAGFRKVRSTVADVNSVVEKLEIRASCESNPSPAKTYERRSSGK